MPARAELDYTLRACQPGDEAALALVGAATFLETYSGVLPGPAILAHCAKQHAPELYRSWLDSSDARICAADMNGAFIGYAVLYPPEPAMNAAPDEIELKRIYLLHRFHGAGVGAALMNWAIRTARDLTMRRMLVGLYEGNHRAMAFYTSFGFRRVGERPFWVGDQKFIDPVLALDLPAAEAAARRR